MRNTCPPCADQTAPWEDDAQGQQLLALSDGRGRATIHLRLDLTAEDHSRGGVEIVEGAVSAVDEGAANKRASSRRPIRGASRPLVRHIRGSREGHRQKRPCHITRNP
jgi:hypothetical protein